MAQDERTVRAAELFHEAAMLLSHLTDLRRRLPDPNMPQGRPLPADWNEFRSYAVCVETLAGSLRFALASVMQGLQFRKEWEIARALQPPTAQLPHDPQSYLRWLDDQLGGGGQPEDRR
jgi:hypothetical protein